MKYRMMVLVASVCFALGGVWSEAMHGIDGFQRAGGRAPFALLFQLLMLRKSPLAGVSRKSFLIAILFGVHLVTFFSGLMMIHPAIAMLLVSMGPMFLPLIELAISAVGRRRPTIARRDVTVSIILWAMVVVYLWFGKLTATEQWGAFWSLCTALLWSICLRLLQMKSTTLAERHTAIAIGNISLFIAVVVFSGGALQAIAANIGWLITYGLVSSGIPHALMAGAVGHIEDRQEPLMIQTIQPLLTFVFVGIASRGTKWPSALEMVWGACLVVILLAYFEVIRREEKQPEPKVE